MHTDGAQAASLRAQEYKEEGALRRTVLNSKMGRAEERQRILCILGQLRSGITASNTNAV